jgi:FecR protein
MNRSIIRTTQSFLIVCVAVTGIFAQQRGVTAADKYKISAKAGLVNYSEGLTSVTHLDGTTGTLITGDQLSAGDKVITSEGGLAEVLLNPGSYLRLGSDSEFSFRVTSLDDLRLDVRRGSAILEVFASNQFRVTAYTPKSRVTIVNSGVYRIDVAADGNGLLSVVEGKAVVGERNVALVKEGNTGTLDGGVVTMGKFDRGKRDALATWSRGRSKDLAKMASAFNAKNTRPLLIDSLVDSYSAGLWGRSRTSGVWVYDPISRQCLFMPFYPNWTTPYGYGYNNCTCYYYLPPTITSTISAIVPPTRLDGRKESPSDFEGGGNNGGQKIFGRERTIDAPTKDSDIFRGREPAPVAPAPVFNPSGKGKPIDN